MLSQIQFEAKWKEIKDGLRSLWGKLTEDELESIKGNIMEVFELVEKKHGETKKEIQMKLRKLMESFDNDTDKQIDPDVSSYKRSPLGGRTSEEFRH
jgi:uncharacterized protein YjbJ (UPF0337 family)